MKLVHRIILLFIFLSIVVSISIAFDQELVGCVAGGDDQLVIGCINLDDELFFTGRIPLPAVIEERIAHMGGTGLGTVKTTEAIRKKAEYPCPTDISFIKRLFSTCRVPNNDICDDGEWFLVDKDCELDNTMFFSMWFLRVLIILSIILLMKNHKYFPVSIIIILLLFYINGAFGTLQTASISGTLTAGQCEETGLYNILLSSCRIDNGVCDYGEYPFRDRDCTLTGERVFSGKIFSEIWLIRLLLIASVILLVLKKKTYAIISGMISAGLIVTNRAITESILFKEVSCKGSDYVINFGPCIAPDYPMMGWMLGLIIIILIYFAFKKLESPGKTTKE